MTTTAQNFRPILAAKEGLAWYKRINWKWILQRIPMLLFATVSSYGVSEYLRLSGTPAPFHQLGGITFDVGFLGVIALADQLLNKSTGSRVYYYVLNITLALLAAIFNVLAHSNGKYANITPEAITAGAPFALVGLAYALFYETVMQQAINKDIEQEAATKFKCKYCGDGFSSQNAMYGHYRSCEKKPKK